MSTVSFKRSANINEIPILDGQLVFDETHNKIYMDNGTERLQYGGDVGLIEDKSYATSNNTFSATGSLNLFTQKLSVIDNKDSALAVTEQYTPVGCLAFQSVIGNANYSTIGNTISDSLVTLKNNLTSAINSVNSQLSANDNKFYFDYQNGKYGFNTSPTRGADTFNPFSSGPLNSNWVAQSYSGSFTAPEAGCYLAWMMNGNIDRISWPVTHWLYVNGTSVPLFQSQSGTWSRQVADLETEYCNVRTSMAFMQLNAGDVVTASVKNGYGTISGISPAIWKYVP